MLITSLIEYYTYFLAVQKCHENSNYTIHGLWIDYNKGGYPEFCDLTKFDINELNNIRVELDKYWISCYDNNEKLWEHEWQKHGTCFNTNMSLFFYFNKTLELYKTKIDKVNLCDKKECLIPI
jgi:ribonuclease T2